MKASAHVIISGRVQGVFFRVETRNQAIKKNIAGWVRNMADGRVEAFFEGEKEDVEKLIVFCKKGPQGAQVTKVDLYWEEYTGKFTGFNIKKTSFS